MAGHRSFKELREKMSPERRARNERRVRQTLAELRDSSHTNQEIESTSGVMGGVACIRQTRIPVWMLEEARRLGTSEAALLHNYPTLTTQDLSNAWDYALSHQEEIDAQIEANEN